MEKIQPLDFSPAGLERDSRFLRECFPNVNYMTTDFLHWEYVQNPVGQAVGFNVFEDGLQLAHAALQPLRVRWNGLEVRGVLSFNSATHPKRRRKGLYFSLAQRAYDRAHELGYEFVIGVANQLSTPGFISKVGFDLLCPLDVRVGLGPIAYNKNRVEPGFEKIWDRESLTWRLSCPTVKYRCVPHDKTTIIYGSARKLGAQAIMGEYPSELCSSFPSFPISSWNPLRLWVGVNQNINWKKSAYFHLPVRFRPSPLNLIFKDLTGTGKKLDPKIVKWAAIDFDTF